MPATPETLADVQDKGCRYIYTHLPRLLGLGAAAFLASLSRSRGEGRVRGGEEFQRRRVWPPLTLTLSPLEWGEGTSAAQCALPYN